MQQRKLGNSALKIAPLMFGGNVLGWTADEATSFKLLDRFVTRLCGEFALLDGSLAGPPDVGECTHRIGSSGAGRRRALVMAQA